MEKKKYYHLRKEQRAVIAAFLRKGLSVSAIAKVIGVHRSTFYREIKRKSRVRGSYSEDYTQVCSDVKKERFSKQRKFTEQLKNLLMKS